MNEKIQRTGIYIYNAPVIAYCDVNQARTNCEEEIYNFIKYAECKSHLHESHPCEEHPKLIDENELKRFIEEVLNKHFGEKEK